MKKLFLLLSILACIDTFAQPKELRWSKVMMNETANRVAGWNGSGVATVLDLSVISPVTSVFGRTGAVTAQNNDYSFAQIGSKPTTLSGYGITDPVVLTSGSYADPSWITSLAYAKITGVPAFTLNGGAANELVKSNGTNIVGTGLFSSVDGFWTRTGNFNLTTTGDATFSTANGVGLHTLNATNNSVYNTGTIEHQTIGSPGAGIGAALVFAVETASGNIETGASIQAVTTNVSSGTEVFNLNFQTMQGGTLADALTLVGSNRTMILSSGVGAGTTSFGRSGITVSSTLGQTDFNINLDDGGSVVDEGQDFSINSGDADNNGNGGDVILNPGLGSGAGREGVLIFPDVPTSDPSVINGVWNNNGFLIQGSQKIYTGSAALDFPSVGSSSSEDLTITVTGASSGDACFVGAVVSTNSNYLFTCYVTSANTVSVRLTNNDAAGSIDLSSRTFIVKVFKL